MTNAKKKKIPEAQSQDSKNDKHTPTHTLTCAHVFITVRKMQHYKL